eukprot:m.337059 g.337059  ORF g.337059 m.337059 type:complete len:167 (-) comp20543_c0_seq25:358-858(-)
MSMADPVIKSHLVLGRPRMTRTQIIAEAQECFASSDATVLGQTLEYFVLAHGSDIVVCERVPTMRQRDAIASAAAMPTALHPLCDSLWISEYGVHGLELFRMFYICPGQTPSDRIRLLRLWRTGEVDQVSRLHRQLISSSPAFNCTVCRHSFARHSIVDISEPSNG